MPARLALAGRLALVTGAGGGIGAALAAALARKGARLALADRDDAALEAAAAAAEAAGAPAVSRHPGDLAAPGAPAALAEAAQEAHGAAPTLLVNNAGIAHGGTFEELAADEFDAVMAVNFAAPVALTRAALPAMLALDAAQIVMVSSLFGLIAPPGQTAYSASKFALRGFAEALRHELAGGPVGVTVAHPGGVRTGIARNALIPAAADQAAARTASEDFERHLKLPPEEAATKILSAAEARAPRVLVGGDARLLSTLQHVAPGNYWPLAARLFGVERPAE